MPVKAKICGLTTEPELETAIEEGADFVGFVLFPKSPRHLELAGAERLAGRARGRTSIVALLVDPDDATVVEVMDRFAPDYIQLHGDETVERTQVIRALSGSGIIKAVTIAAPGDLKRAQGYLAAHAADWLLYDAKPAPDAALPGGNGIPFDWALLAGPRKRHAFMLSGGLTPENVATAIRVTGADAIDVSSGVETARGVKSSELIRRFLRQVKIAKEA